MDSIYKFLKKVSEILKIIGEIGVFVIMTLMVVNILLRVLLNSPITGVYDIEGLIFVVTISLPLAYVATLDGHVYVDFFIKMFSEGTQNILNVFTKGISIILFSLIGWKVVQYGNLMKHRARGTMTTGTPLYPFFYIMAGGIFLLVIILVFKSIPKYNKDGEE